MPKKLIILMAIIGLLAMSGVAAAAQSEDEADPEATTQDEREDTTFNFGYDEEAGVFVWGSAPSDGTYDCTLENGTLTATYTRVPEAVLVDELLDESGETVTFEPTPEGELAEGLEPATESVEYTGSDGECGVLGGEVAGPEGQVNHGMFLKLFNSMFEGRGRGCLVRHIAQSDLGKGDQQIRVEDVDPDAEQVDEGSIDFETVLADCVHGPDEEGEEVEGQSRAAQVRSEKAGDGADNGRRGPPAHAKGKADSAPGRNK